MVTYEPCAYEMIPQPKAPKKKNYVLHLASLEPHKRTEQLVRWWISGGEDGIELPELHLVGTVSKEILEKINNHFNIVKRPFLSDLELQTTYREALALILPSEIEGFGLPALEAYFLGTPVCFVKSTSVEEVLSPATRKGGMILEERQSLFDALNEVMEIDEVELAEYAQILRKEYHSTKIANHMLKVFEKMKKNKFCRF